MNEFNKRFTEILRLLKAKGIKQIQIIRKIEADYSCDETVFSNLKSGKIKNIPDALIDALHKHYNVNPGYLRLESDSPFDTIEIKLENFENFVDNWDIVENGEDKYLHLTIKQNFYDFLLDLFRANEITAKGFSSYEQEKKALKELYESSPSPEEFVLLPRNNFIEIIEDTIKKHKQVSEVLDFLKYETYLDAIPPKTTNTTCAKSKKDILDQIRKEI